MIQFGNVSSMSVPILQEFLSGNEKGNYYEYPIKSNILGITTINETYVEIELVGTTETKTLFSICALDFLISILNKSKDIHKDWNCFCKIMKDVKEDFV